MARELKNIKTKELSFVDTPANKKKFLFFKREKSDEKSHADSNSKFKKGVIDMDSELIELMKEYFGDEFLADEFEKAEKLSEKAMNAIKGALRLINKYKAEFPDDLKKAIGVLAKYAGYGYGYPAKKEKEDVEKSGAKFSKDTLEKLKKAVEALEALKAVLPELVEKTVEKFTKSAEEKFNEALDNVKNRLDIVEKSTGFKKSIEGQDDDNSSGNSDLKWPSLSS